MDPFELKKEYGKDLTLCGGIGTQRLLPYGSAGKIRSQIRKLKSVMGRGGGYILAPAKALQPETPTENAAAVVEAFLQQAGVALPA